MSELVFTRHPVDGGADAIGGLFGQVYRIGPRPAYPHRGVDYTVGVGTPVYAPAPGVVVAFGNDGSFGQGVCLDHEGTPWYSLYAHLSRVDVRIGQHVSAGERLGLSGNTGFVTGPHLHWQMCRSRQFPPDIGQSTDPLRFVRNDELLNAFMREVLVALGIEPSWTRLTMLRAWAGREGMPLITTWNPLATTSAHQPLRLNTEWDIGHGPGNWNSVPVRVYATRADGVRATADTIALDHYPNIRKALRQETGLDAAAADFRTWIGPDHNYGPALIDEWKSIAAAAPQLEDIGDEMAALEAVRELNRAMVMREEIRRVASDPYLPAVERAHAALVGAGLIQKAED